MTKRQLSVRLTEDEYKEFVIFLDKESIGETIAEKFKNKVMQLLRPTGLDDAKANYNKCPFFCLTPDDIVECGRHWIRRGIIKKVSLKFCRTVCPTLQEELKALGKIEEFQFYPHYNNYLKKRVIEKTTEQTEETRTTEEAAEQELEKHEEEHGKINLKNAHFCKFKATTFYDSKLLPCIKRELRCEEAECLQKVADKFLGKE